MNTFSAVSHTFLQKTLALVLLACLIAGCIAVGGTQTAFAAESPELSPADLYEQNVNSTVGITISGETTSRYGYGRTYEASGSGFILSEDGYILTNYHVIEDGSNITVTTFDNQSFTAAVVGYDSGNDIAVLKVEAEGLTR